MTTEHIKWQKKIIKENHFLVITGLNHVVMHSPSLSECVKECERQPKYNNATIYKKYKKR